MKNILIVGSSGFLGSVVTAHLASKHNIFAADINKVSLKILKKKNPKINIKYLDVSKEKDVKNYFFDLKKKKIFINSLINLAAIDSKVSLKGNTSIYINNQRYWNKEIEVSVNGNLNLFKYFGNAMVKKKTGKFILIGSDLSVIAPNQNIYKKAFKNYLKPPSYPILKHALLGITKYYASIYAKDNVNVNMISPGSIDNNPPKKFQDEFKLIVPSKRMATRQNILPSIDFLLDENNTYINGQNILIDGGRSII
jgi:NAD(P)-dependent dehydrogenase (short-subunit alcohol dehydrogenase family)